MLSIFLVTAIALFVCLSPLKAGECDGQHAKPAGATEGEAVKQAPAQPEAEVFYDPECTVPVHTVHWGEEVERGQGLEFVFYVKNTGTEPIDAGITIPDDVSAIMSYTFTPASLPLTANQTGNITLSIDILPDAPLGYYESSYDGYTP